jgi:hypothetical protein
MQTLTPKRAAPQFESIMSSARELAAQDARWERRVACLSFVQPGHLDMKKACLL